MAKKKAKLACTRCGKTYDPQRYPNGCPDCQTTRLNLALGRKVGGNIDNTMRAARSLDKVTGKHQRLMRGRY